MLQSVYGDLDVKFAYIPENDQSWQEQTFCLFFMTVAYSLIKVFVQIMNVQYGPQPTQAN